VQQSIIDVQCGSHMHEYASDRHICQAAVRRLPFGAGTALRLFQSLGLTLSPECDRFSEVT
jgi:hypothetical protein